MERSLLLAPQAELDMNYLWGVFRCFKRPQDKITYLIKSGDLLPVRRGVYVSAPIYGKLPSTQILASMIYSPSYLSLESSLKHYQIIPEAIWGEISVTTRKPKRFSTQWGEFDYHNSSLKDFLWGIRFIKLDDNRQCRVASPIKALYDLIRYRVANYTQKTYEELFEYVELLRLDLDEVTITESEYVEVSKSHKTYIRRFLLRWIKDVGLEITDAR